MIGTWPEATLIRCPNSRKGFDISLLVELLIATVMVSATTVVHLVGLGMLLYLLRRADRARHKIAAQALSVGSIALGLFALHAIEIWAYAVLYAFAGPIGSMEEALYFSTASFTTVGYGDVVLPKGWRVIGAIESANGLILLGWSTAFFISIATRLRVLERELEEEL